MRIIFLLAFIVVGSTLSFGQNIREQKSTMSLGPQNCFYVDIEGADKDLLEDSWKEYLKEFGKLENNKKAKEQYMMNARIPIINGVSPVNLYIKNEEGKNLATSYIWVDLIGSFANSSDNKTQSQGINTFLTDYFHIVKKKVISKELEQQEKVKKNLDKDLVKLENKNKDYHEDIEKAKKKIAEAEKNIEQNLKDQEMKKAEILKQADVVNEVITRLNSVGKM